VLGVRRWREFVADRKKGRTLFDRPKSTVGCSSNGRRRRRRRRRSKFHTHTHTHTYITSTSHNLTNPTMRRLEKLTVFKLVETYSAFCGTLRYITEFT